MKTPKQKDHFSTKYLESSLASRSLKGGTLAFASQGLSFVLRMGTTVVMARLLTPADFGLIAMVTAVTGFVALFKDLGLSMATVQREEITHEQVSALFWINLMVGTLTCLVTMGLAPVIAWFYDKHELLNVTLCLSVNFVLVGLGVQHQALLRRHMRFFALYSVETLAYISNILVSIGSAYFGVRYYAIVFGMLTNSLVLSGGFWVVSGWIPGWFTKNSQIGSMLAFGFNLTGYRLVNYFSRNMDNILIGRYMGAATLGLYDKAYQLLLLPVQQINWPLTNVVVPALSRLQNDGKKFSEYYYKAIQLVTSITMPVVFFLFIKADTVIMIMLGKQWTGSVEIFRALAPAALIGVVNIAPGWVYLSLGRTDRQLKWGIFASLVTVLSFIIGIRWGALGIATAFSVQSVTKFFPGIVYCYRGTGLRLWDLVKSLRIAAIISIVPSMFLFAYKLTVASPTGIIEELIIPFVCFFLISFLLFVFLTESVRKKVLAFRWLHSAT